MLLPAVTEVGVIVACPWCASAELVLPIKFVHCAAETVLPVATFAIGEAGAANSALHAIANLAMNDAALAEKLTAFREKQYEHAVNMKLTPIE